MVAAAACLLPVLLATGALTGSVSRGCCPSLHLKFGVPAIDWSPVLNGRMRPLRGYVLEYWDAVARELSMRYQFVPFGSQNPQEMLDALKNGTLDVILYPLSGGLMIDPAVTPTVPVIDDVSSAFVHKTRASVRLARFLDPFTPQLWMAVVLCVISAAALMLVLRALQLPGCLGVREWCKYACRTVEVGWAVLLGGDDYDWSELGYPGQLLQLGILFFVLIIVATYTANLAAFFTKPSFEIHGPQSMEQLRGAKVCVAALGQLGLEGGVQSYAPSFTESSSAALLATDMDNEYQRCYDALADGSADVWVDPLSFANKFYLTKCNSVHKLQWFSAVPVRFGFVLRSENRTVANHVSSALLWLFNTDKYVQLRSKSLGIGQACGGQSSGTDPVTITQMSGVFMFFGVLAVGALVLAVVRRVAKGPRGAERAGDDARDSAAGDDDQRRPSTVQQTEPLEAEEPDHAGESGSMEPDAASTPA
eukprot:TRINITY_DN28806_c0_g1_i1.p1 TRINITY_DN28806_c0_g1~~TRINITY_DN28806_c0_g1_i1.p1  ORF type:complete len:494 (+),score=144.21 TRINITY_DN28806_c0_g1_i1:50-1483(+)